MTDAANVPARLYEGARVKHTTFGTGTVHRLGDHESVPVVSIDFGYGERKALALEFGLAHLSRMSRWSRRTPAKRGVLCDICGGRPVVVSVDGQQYCEAHGDRYRA